MTTTTMTMTTTTTTMMVSSPSSSSSSRVPSTPPPPEAPSMIPKSSSIVSRTDFTSRQKLPGSSPGSPTPSGRGFSTIPTSVMATAISPILPSIAGRSCGRESGSSLMRMARLSFPPWSSRTSLPVKSPLVPASPMRKMPRFASSYEATAPRHSTIRNSSKPSSAR